jgi:hypothetical protein
MESLIRISRVSWKINYLLVFFIGILSGFWIVQFIQGFTSFSLDFNNLVSAVFTASLTALALNQLNISYETYSQQIKNNLPELSVNSGSPVKDNGTLGVPQIALKNHGKSSAWKINIELMDSDDKKIINNFYMERLDPDAERVIYINKKYNKITSSVIVNTSYSIDEKNTYRNSRSDHFWIPE